MATDTERLVLEMSAKLNQFEKAMLDAAGSADRAAARIERRFQEQNAKVTKGFNDFANNIRTILATIGVGVLIRDVTELGDTWTVVGNRLAFAGVEASKLAAVQNVVADIASRTRSDLDATADLFSRMFRSANDLGASLAQVAAVTEIVSKALAGAAQSERQGAIRQLGQGLGSGRLQGDELRSILENSRPIAQAIADEFQTTIGNLRNLGQQGVLESRRVFHAILTAGDDIDRAFARTNFTVADSFTRLRTEAARFIGTNEQTSGSVRALTRLINFVADNFQTLADATVLAATVIGGALAGVAILRATTALGALATSAATARGAMAFFGGPLGIILAAAGGALAYVATQTDLLTSSTQVLERATASGYSGLQKLVSLRDDLEALASAGHQAGSGTGAVATAARDAEAALNRWNGTADDTENHLSIQGRMTNALAEQQRQLTISTLQQAVADERAAVAALRRDAANRSLLTGIFALLFANGPSDDPSRTAQRRAGQLSPQEQRQIEEHLETLRVLQEGLNAAQSLSAETWGQIFELTNGTAHATAATAAAQAQERHELELSLQLALARARHDEQRVRSLSDQIEIERLTAQLVKNGVSATEALARATQQVTDLRKAENAEGLRNYEIQQLQNQAEIARVLNQQSLVDKLGDELEIRRRTRELVDQMAMTEANARALAEEFVATQREARELDRQHQLENRDLQTALDAARARGDDAAELAIQRRLELEQRISDLRRLGLSEEAATERASKEVASLERADMQGKFREWFTGGVTAALDGDLSDFFENWWRERVANATTRALNELADQLFAAFEPILTNIMHAGTDGLGQTVAAAFSKAGGGALSKLQEDAGAAGEALRAVLGGSAKEAAAKLALTATSSAANAAKEAAATAQSISSAAFASSALVILAKAAAAAASALGQLSAGGGGKGGGLLNGIFSAVASAFGGKGGFDSFGNKIPGFAGGGSPPIGKWFTVGEHGPERMKLGTSSFVLPNGVGAGGATVVYNDNSVRNFRGTQEEFNAFRAEYEADVRTRKQQIYAVVENGFGRRDILRG